MFLKTKIIFILIIAILSLTGCKKISELATYNQVNEPQINQINETAINETLINQTDNITNETKIKQGKLNIFIFKSSGQCIFIVDESGISSMINCGGTDFFTALKNLNKLNYEKIDKYYFSDIDKNIDLLVDKFKPDKIIQTNYIVFNNSIIMLNGINSEIEIEAENKDILFLSNNGGCETNSLSFLVQINPSVVFSNKNICYEQKQFIDALGIKVYNKDLSSFQIVFDGEGYEVKEI